MAARKTTASETKQEIPTTTKLYRSEKNRVLAGVAGGLGDFFNVDPTLIRLLFLVVAFFGGGGIILYLILWLIIPKQSHVTEISKESIRANADEIRQRAQSFVDEVKVNTEGRNSRSMFGVILLVLGVMFLFSNFGFFKLFDFSKFWPLVLIVIGLAILFKSER